LPRSASPEDIRKAYLTYAAKFHPDKHHGDLFFEERFKEIREAYDTLSDDEKRVKYDLKKFGRSRVNRKAYYQAEVPAGVARKRCFRMEWQHPEIYLTLFYVINLGACILIKRIGDHASIRGHIWSLFLCAASALLMWRFLTGLLTSHQYHPRSIRILLLCLALSLATGTVPLFTRWVP
jgi:hypothetical protein